MKQPARVPCHRRASVLRCANLRCDEPVGGQDLGAAVDAQLVDQQLEERLGLAWVSFGGDGFENVGDFGEVGGWGRVCGLVWRLNREFGFLGAEIVQARLQAGEPGQITYALVELIFNWFGLTARSSRTRRQTPGRSTRRPSSASATKALQTEIVII
jgi:hypothetical protein